MSREIERIVTEDVIPVLRATLRETTGLRGAVQVLADRVDRLCRYCKRVTLARYEELASPAGLRRLGHRLLRLGRRDRST